MRIKHRKEREKMIITQSQAKALRRKKADLQLKNYELAFEIGVSPKTVPKILKGDYKAPKRIYASVICLLPMAVSRVCRGSFSPNFSLPQ